MMTKGEHNKYWEKKDKEIYILQMRNFYMIWAQVNILP